MILPEMKLLISRDRIAAEVRRLGEEISRDYRDAGEILLVGVLKGSFLFFADLARAVTVPVAVDFVRLASYGTQTRSSGLVEMRKDLELSVRGRDVVIVEDIVDSGCTLETLYHLLQLREPRTLRVATLLDKFGRREGAVRADYVGITMEDGFVVGYGLDFDERFRNLPDIYLLEGA